MIRKYVITKDEYEELENTVAKVIKSAIGNEITATKCVIIASVRSRGEKYSIKVEIIDEDFQKLTKALYGVVVLDNKKLFGAKIDIRSSRNENCNCDIHEDETCSCDLPSLKDCEKEWIMETTKEVIEEIKNKLGVIEDEC